MIAQPGDNIIVTDPICHSIWGRVCDVIECNIKPPKVKDISEYIWVKEVNDPIDKAFWLRHNHYEVLEDYTKAAVGDKVIITYKHWEDVYLKTFTVEEVREYEVLLVAGICITVDKCRILKRHKKVVVQLCPECKGAGMVQLFTSTVRCKCNEKD